jgi:hypothetical protein
MEKARLQLFSFDNMSVAQEKARQLKDIIGVEPIAYDILVEASRDRYAIVAEDRKGIGLQNLAEYVISDMFDMRRITRETMVKRITLVKSRSRLDAARRFKAVFKKARYTFIDCRYVFGQSNGEYYFQLEVMDDISGLKFVDILIDALFSNFEALVMNGNPNSICVASGLTKNMAEQVSIAINQRIKAGKILAHKIGEGRTYSYLISEREARRVLDELRQPKN